MSTQGITLVCLLSLLCTYVRAEDYQSITEAQIKTITFDDCNDDTGRISPVAPDITHLKNEELKRFEKLVTKLNASKLNTEKDVGQRVRNLIGISAFVDVSRSEFEGELACHVFETLKKEVPKDTLIKVCAWIAIKPGAGTAVKTAPDLGYDFEMDEQALRDRSALYARKLLGRLLNKLPAKP